MDRTLLLVSGAGRSGTSSIAGALSLLGAHVPGPYLETNASNPKGFYESQWSVDLHNRILRRAAVLLADGRPEALARMQATVREAERAELGAWIAANTPGHDLTVLKDPRTAWTLGLWQQQAAELDVRQVLVTMLRHPAEVLGSRSTHYVSADAQLGERGFRVRNLAGWVNAMLITEAQTRDWPRSLIRYDDLLQDWRGTLAPVNEHLGLGLDDQLRSTQAHPVDDFIDPTLSRHRISWAEAEVPPALREVADSVWGACVQLADHDGRDPEAEAELDAARDRYDAMYLAGQQLTHDTTTAATTAGRRAGVRAERRRATKSGADQRSVPGGRRRRLFGRRGSGA